MEGRTFRYIHQNFIDEDIDRIRVETIHEKALTNEIIDDFLDSAQHPVGVSAAFSESDHRLVLLAVSCQSKIMLIEFWSNKNPKTRNLSGRELLQSRVLCRPHANLVAFDFKDVALALYRDLGLRVVNGVDIQSAFSSSRLPLEAVKQAFGDSDVTIHEDNIRDSFERSNTPDQDPKRQSNIGLRAWISQYLAEIGSMEDAISNAKKIDTTSMTAEMLDYMSKTAHDDRLQEQEQPSHVTQQVPMTWDAGKNRMVATSSRYQNKIRTSERQRLKVSVGGSKAGYVLPAQVASAEGKSADIAIGGVGGSHLEGKVVGSVTISGRGDLTVAEKKRDAVLLQMLQGNSSVWKDNPWMKKIYSPSDEFTWPSHFASATSRGVKPNLSTLTYPLNTSQIISVKAMLSSADDKRLCLIQGPPGTGKTTVIASYVHLATRAHQKGIWLVAQSNVAVKNIAEKLFNVGFMDWKLIVSKDFQFEWHDHLYSKISANVIRSDKFSDHKLRKELQSSSVILCTLSMLSHPKLGFISRFNPVTSLIIDEASQIGLGDYLPVFEKYPTLRKICFIGDDKQLPPHGQEKNQDLQSIFEVPHLRDSALFLDTQYRMPPQIGDFISAAVYDGQLLSNPSHPVTSEITSCYLIDVSHGQEQRQAGETSYQNFGEYDATLTIAKHLQSLGKSYKIISCYDAQRSLIEDGMKERGLDWEDKCFNVDSFQGNEDDYIVISTVRTRELGFLRNLRRTNVMLTRCKRGMFICSSRAFLEKGGAKSLVGKMAAEFGEKGWVDVKDLTEFLTRLV